MDDSTREALLDFGVALDLSAEFLAAASADARRLAARGVGELSVRAVFAEAALRSAQATLRRVRVVLGGELAEAARENAGLVEAGDPRARPF